MGQLNSLCGQKNVQYQRESSRLSGEQQITVSELSSQHNPVFSTLRPVTICFTDIYADKSAFVFANIKLLGYLILSFYGLTIKILQIGDF